MAMKNKDIKALSVADVNTRLLELDRELMKLNAQRSTGASQKNNKQIRLLKRTKAKLLTKLSQGGKSGQ